MSKNRLNGEFLGNIAPTARCFQVLENFQHNSQARENLFPLRSAHINFDSQNTAPYFEANMKLKKNVLLDVIEICKDTPIFRNDCADASEKSTHGMGISDEINTTTAKTYQQRYMFMLFTEREA